MKAFLILIAIFSCHTYTLIGQSITFKDLPSQFCYDQKAYIHFSKEGEFKNEEFILYRKNFDLSNTELGRSTVDSILITPTFSSLIFIESSKSKVTSKTLTLNVDSYTGPFLRFGIEPVCSEFTNKIEVYTGFIEGDAFMWYRNDSILQGAKEAIYLATKSGTYKAKLKRKNCLYSVGGTANILIGEIRKPTLSTEHRPEICEGFSVSINANVPNISELKYQWLFNQDTLKTETKSVLSAQKSGNYQLLIRQGKCKNLSDNFVVRIGNLKASSILTSPVPATNDVFTICEGLTGELKIGDYQTRNDMEIYWLKDGKIDATLTNKKSVQIKDKGTYTYLLKQGKCEVLSNPLLVKIGGMKGFDLYSNESTAVCEGQTANILASPRNSSLINNSFNFKLFRGEEVVANVPFIFSNLQISSSGDYYIKGNYGTSQCQIYSDTISVNFSKNVVPFDLNKGITEIQACADSTILGNGFSLTGINSTDVKFNWTFNGKAVDNKNKKQISIKQDGVYSLKVDIDSTCSYQSSPLNLKLKKIQAQVSNLDPFCSDNLTQLSVKVGTDKIRIQDKNGSLLLGNELTYQWFEKSDTLGRFKEQSIVKSGTYKALVKLGQCQTETMVFPVQLLEINKTLKPEKDTLGICPDGGIARITAAGIADSYEWIKNDFSANSNEYFIDATSTGAYKVWMKKNGCAVFSNSMTIIKSDKRPTAAISGGEKIELGKESEIRIDLTASGPWTFLLSSGDQVTTNETPYIWKVKPSENTVYAITTVSNPCGSGETFGIVDIEIFVLGNEEEQIENLMVYPNPTADKLRIEFLSNASSRNEIMLYNLEGKVLKESTFHTNGIELDISDLPNGSYILKVITGDKVMSRRLVKKD